MTLDPGFISTVPGTVSTQGMQSASPFGGSPLGGSDFFSEMIRRKMAQQDALRAQQEQDHQLQMQMEQERLKAMRTANQPHETYGGAGADAQARYMGQRAALIQAQDASRPAPLKMITGAQIIPGYVNDTNAMDSYQRQMFLPGNAQFGGGGAGDSGARPDQGAGLGALYYDQKRQEDADARRRLIEHLGDRGPGGS